jgi:hypothetical protein
MRASCWLLVTMCSIVRHTYYLAGIGMCWHSARRSLRASTLPGQRISGHS